MLVAWGHTSCQCVSHLHTKCLSYVSHLQMRASSTAAVDSNAAGGPYRPRVRFATDAPYLRTPALLLPLLLPLLLLPGRSLMARAGGECVPPAFNPEAAAPGSCHLLQRVCVDEGTILSFDTQFRGLEKPPFPRIEQVPW